jgi:hypothetical protein
MTLFLFTVLTWVSAFLVMIPTPPSINFLNVVFTAFYCVLNVIFGIFLLISTVFMAKVAKRHDHRILRSSRITAASAKLKHQETLTSDNVVVARNNLKHLNAVSENKYKIPVVEKKEPEGVTGFWIYRHESRILNVNRLEQQDNLKTVSETDSGKRFTVNDNSRLTINREITAVDEILMIKND